ncbi:hypothetical protein PoB_007265600 [Plakobranchus ocellatus]|uniref:Uncharacterized protein n=1 Tax=Plakobranchus ocellatus TaxID=259542 RepID=A0AAV4DQH0_9GAST|nr:hypothetical protein PoB_007265600 [Plakobranchus ocellatus]
MEKKKSFNPPIFNPRGTNLYKSSLSHGSDLLQLSTGYFYHKVYSQFSADLLHTESILYIINIMLANVYNTHRGKSGYCNLSDDVIIDLQSNEPIGASLPPPPPPPVRQG